MPLICYSPRMKGLLIRKAFYDGWDSVLFLLLGNILLFVVAFGGFALAHLTAPTFGIFLTILAIAILLLGVLLLAISDELARVSAFQPFSLKRFFLSMKKYLLLGPLYILIFIFFLVLFPLAVYWYFSLGGLLGTVLGLIMFWISLIFYLAFQWFLPVKSQLEGNFVKALKKCFIIFFDNPGFSLFMLLYSLVILVLSMIPFLLLPGISGILLAQNEAFRLLMRKYDWMEEHPELDFATARKNVPWDEVLSEEYDAVDSRSLKGLIFPWRD